MFTNKSESICLQARYSATGRWPGGRKSSDWGTDLSWKTGESRSPPRESTIFMPRYCFSTLTVLLQLVCVTDKLPGWERCEWFPGKRVYFIQFYMCESAFCIFYVCESVIMDTFMCVRMYSLHFFVCTVHDVWIISRSMWTTRRPSSAPLWPTPPLWPPRPTPATQVKLCHKSALPSLLQGGVTFLEHGDQVFVKNLDANR